MSSRLDGPASILMMIGSVETLQKYQISTSDNPLCCRGHCWGLVKWFPQMFVCIPTEIYSVEMFSLRRVVTVKMIWSDKHEIVGGSFQLFTFYQISSTKSPQSLTIAGLLDFRCNFTTLEVGKGF